MRATRTLTITVLDPLNIVTNSLPKAVRGMPYEVQCVYEGGDEPVSWLGVVMPAGLQISGSGLITGSPTSSGVQTVTLGVVDVGG